MRCIPECGFNHLPTNGLKLAEHMADCSLNGPLSNIEEVFVVWRDGSYAVVSKVDDEEQTFDIGFKKINHEIKLPILDVDLIDGVNVEIIEPLSGLDSNPQVNLKMGPTP